MSLFEKFLKDFTKEINKLSASEVKAKEQELKDFISKIMFIFESKTKNESSIKQISEK